jgi:hypothetical protein
LGYEKIIDYWGEEATNMCGLRENPTIGHVFPYCTKVKKTTPKKIEVRKTHQII